MSKTKVTLTVKSWKQNVGDTIEVDADTAKRLIDNRQAVPVAGSPAKGKEDA